MERGLIVVPLGPLQSNMYIITGPSGIFIIDPSVSLAKTEVFCSTIPELAGISVGKLEVKAFLLTHGHHDHIKFIDAWSKAYPNAEIFFSSKDQELLDSEYWNCSYMEGEDTTYHFKYSDLAGKDDQVIYKDSAIEIKVYETPGHTMGGVCYLVTLGGRRKLFTGDTVFSGSVGRTDMHGGTSKLIIESVMRIKTFDPELPIYPGHGPDSTIEEEIRVNPFFDL